MIYVCLNDSTDHGLNVIQRLDSDRVLFIPSPISLHSWLYDTVSRRSHCCTMESVIVIRPAVGCNTYSMIDPIVLMNHHKHWLEATMRNYSSFTLGDRWHSHKTKLLQLKRNLKNTTISR